jgi:hypothetical protein
MKGLGGLAETGVSMATGAAATVAGNVAGAARTATSGSDFGTAEGVRKGGETAAKVRDFLTYQPRSEVGQEMTESVGKLMAPLEGLPPHVALPAASDSSRARRELQSTTLKVRDLIERPSKRVAAGNPPWLASAPPRRTPRAWRASGPPRCRCRSLATGRSPRARRSETSSSCGSSAKRPSRGKAGAPLRERADNQNDAILQNFDAWVDQTGAEAPSRYHAGRAVDEAVVERAKAAKVRINAAYDRARKSGHMNEPVPTDEVLAYLQKNAAAGINAGVIPGALQKLKELGGVGKDGAAGAISINDLEELRILVGEMSGKDATNAKYGRSIKEVIDRSMEGRGGELFQQARKLRSDFAREFEDHAIVDRIMSTKPGTKDRAVAFEDVFDHSILKSDQDSLKHFRTLLQNAGPKGEQAWKELQGQTVEWLKGEATKGVALNERRQPVVSPAALKKAIRTLDADGKLDILYGKKGAQQIRDLGDLAQDVYTVPSGTVQTSGTASILMEAISNAALGKLPTAAGKIVLGFKNFREGRTTQRKVREALDDPRAVKEMETE